MAVIPVPRTWTVGEIVTAAEMNANVRDAANFLLAKPLASLIQNSAQNVSNVTFTNLALDSEFIDSDNAHSNVTNNHRFTAVTPGWYLVLAHSDWVANGTGNRIIRLIRNGATMPGTSQIMAANASVTGGPTISDILFLDVGDWVGAQVWQSSGGTLATNPPSSDEHGCTFNVFMVST